MLLDLAAFQNVQQNAQMAVTGQHLMRNLNTGAKSQTQFLDDPQGRYSQVQNTNNQGQMLIQGRHQYGNYVNNGQTQVVARKFPGPANAPPPRLEDLQEYEEPELENLEETEEPEVENLEETEEPEVENLEEEPEVENLEEEPEQLEDLAAFNQYANQKGGNTQIEGTHSFKAMNNQAGGVVNVKDNQAGQFATFGATNNAGKMMVSGNHQFDNTTNSGQMLVNPRTFNEKGQKVGILMDLVSFKNMNNKATGQISMEGTHQVENIKNEKSKDGKKKGKVMFNDNKDGQFVAVKNAINDGDMSFSGKHAIQNITNTGNLTAIPRKFKDKKKELMLVDLAAFNNFANQDGGMAQFQGTHTIKNLSNAKKGQVVFNDDPQGRFVTVGNTNNLGKMNISGLHQFDQFTNAGNVAVAPRQYNEKGQKVGLLLI